MLRCLFITIVSASVLLSGCSLFLPRESAAKQQYFWNEDGAKNPLSRKARIESLKREIKLCDNTLACTELNFQIAVLFLNNKPLKISHLKSASRYLNVASKGGQYKELAQVLYKTVNGWISENNKTKKLQKSLDRVKAVDLEFRQE